MFKPNASYKMSRAGKTYLANTWNRPMMNQRKKSLIEAEIAGRQIPKSKKEKDA